MSDHYHYEYAGERHDHRGDYADQRHDHDGDYAEKHHRHYDDESAVRGLRQDLAAAEDRIRALEDDLRGALAFIRVLDRLRPTCVICRDATADRQTVRGPACSDCVGDLPDDGPDPDRPETWAFGEADEGPAAMRLFMREHPIGAPRQTSRVYWPDALCEFADHDMCGEPAVARVTSRAEPSEHLWCCGPHRDHLLRINPDDAYVSWAKPGEVTPAASAGCAETGQDR